jgi:hypothetical protein
MFSWYWQDLFEKKEQYRKFVRINFAEELPSGLQKYIFAHTTAEFLETVGEHETCCETVDEWNVAASFDPLENSGYYMYHLLQY